MELGEEIKQLIEENAELKKKLEGYGESIPSDLGSKRILTTGSGEESITGC